MFRQAGTGGAVLFGVGLHLRQADRSPGIVAVRIVAEGMQPGEELVHGKAGKEHVDADDCRAFLADAPDVTDLEPLLIFRRIRPAKCLGLDLIGRDDTPAYQAGPSRLEILNTTTDLRDRRHHPLPGERRHRNTAGNKRQLGD